MAAASLLAPAAASAAPFQFDCRSEMGRNPNLWIEQPGPNYRLRGRLTSVRLVRWPYPPGPIMMKGDTIPPFSRNAYLEIGSRMGGNHAGLSFIADDGVEDRIRIGAGFVLYSDAATDPVESARDVMTVQMDEVGRVSVPFELAADPQGVTVVVAGQSMRFDVPIGVDGEIRIGCTGGDFMFRGLDWDR